MREPERGDVVSVDWVDIFEDVTGDPDQARLSRRTSYGLFWDRREDDGVPSIITTTTVDREDLGQQGFCIYPAACVVALKIIKRARRAPRRPPVPSVPRTGDQKFG